MHIFKYQLKLLVRNRTMVFWTLLFPLILATFFNMAFSQLISSEGFEPAKLAVVEEQSDVELNALFHELSQKTENQLLDVQYVSLSKAESLLKADEIAGYVIVNDDLKLMIHDNGISQTIIQSVLDTYLQTKESMNSLAEINPQAFIQMAQDKIDLNYDYLKSQNISSLDLTVIYFYTLIGMTCMYGGFWGLKVTNLTEANLSRQGTRLNVAPTSKLKVIFTGTIAAFICQYIAMLGLLLYLIFGLNIAFGDQVGYILVLMAIGSYVGITVGNLIGHILKCNENTKVSVLTSVSLFCSFLSGMMIVDLKYFIQENVPVLGYMNPVNLITDALYALYYYPTYERFFMNVGILIGISGFLTFASILISRRKKYDSL